MFTHAMNALITTPCRGRGGELAPSGLTAAMPVLAGEASERPVSPRASVPGPFAPRQRTQF
jgi:hypothetical protein